MVSIEVNAFKGGLDTNAKKLLIEQFTAIVAQYADMSADGPKPVYIVIRDVKPSDWGIFGKTITLEDVRNPPENAIPI